jgi:AraC-like DNA-binding protein
MGINQLEGHFEGGTDRCETHLLQAVISGALRCKRGDESQVVEAGEIFIAPARGPHGVALESPSCETVWFHLHQVPRWEYLLTLEDNVQTLFAPTELKHAMAHFFEAMRRDTAYAAEVTVHYADILVLLLDRELQNLHSPSERQRQQDFLKLWHEVRENPTYPWSGRELARRMGVAPAYLPGLCRRLFGVTPMQKVAAIRMELAQHLLTGTNHSLAQIAEQVGYQTEYAFSDAFKRITGQRPGAVRRASGQ